MKRIASLELLPLGLLVALTTTACIAPAKNVGIESDTEGETESESDSETSPVSDTDGSATSPSTSGESESMSTSGATDSDSESDSETGEGCGFNEESACRALEGCVWAEVQRIDAADDFCGFGEDRGFCYDAPEGAGCSENPLCEDGLGYWYREINEGSWEVDDRNGDCIDALPGFSPCLYDGNDPPVCSCACLDEGEPTLPPGFEETLQPGGCSDIHIYAANPEDTIGLRLSIDEAIVAGVQSSMENYSEELDVSAFERIELEVGEHITHYDCNDAVEFEPLVAKQWTAEAGTVSLEVVPNEGASEGAFATVTFNNVQMVSGGDTITLDGLTFEDLFVGWLPG